MKPLRGMLILLVISTGTMAATQSAEKRISVNIPATADAASLAIAPDGDKIAFVAPSEGSDRLWVHSLSAGSSRPLPATSDAILSTPCWSPDSTSIAYFSQNRLMRIDVEAGSPRVLVDGVTRGRGCSWNRDGTLLFGLGGGRVIYRISEQGGSPAPATPPDVQPMHSPFFLPDNRHFLYFQAGGGGVFVAEIGGAAPRKLLDSETAAVYSGSGHILFVRKGILYAQKFDPETLQLSGEPLVVDRPIATNAFRPAVSTAPDGTLIYRTGASGVQGELKWLDRGGKELQTFKDLFSIANSPPMLSADGQFLLLGGTTDGNVDVFSLELASWKLTRVTTSPTIDVYPVWSPDRKTIYFSSNQSGRFDLYERPADLSAEEKLVMPTVTQRQARAVSKDGRFVLYRGASGDIWAVQLDGSPRGEFPVVQTKGNNEWPQFSPDARWVAYQSTESGRFEVYLQQFPTGRRVQISMEGGGHPKWSPDGRELFYMTSNFQLMAVPMDLTNAQNPVAGKPHELFAAPLSGDFAADTMTPQYNVSPDGQRFLFLVIVPVSSPLTVIRNWQPH